MKTEYSFSHGSYVHQISEKPSNRFRRHCHDQYELLFVLKGRGDFVVEGIKYPLYPGTVMLFRQSEYHFVSVSEEEPYERIILSFDKTVPIDAASRLRFLTIEAMPTHGVYFCNEGLFDRILPSLLVLERLDHEAFRQHPSRREVLLQATVSQILLLLSLEQAHDSDIDIHPIVHRLIDYINDHLTETLTLEFLAQHFFISKYHLCRIFKEHMGISPLKYISTKRLLMAKQLIQEGNTASKAALNVGFHDYSSFYRAYRAQFGYPPSDSKST